jgi:hypothetical protein
MIISCGLNVVIHIKSARFTCATDWVNKKQGVVLAVIYTTITHWVPKHTIGTGY